jgi:hypothetical protein
MEKGRHKTQFALDLYEHEGFQAGRIKGSILDLLLTLRCQKIPYGNVDSALLLAHAG